MQAVNVREERDACGLRGVLHFPHARPWEPDARAHPCARAWVNALAAARKRAADLLHAACGEDILACNGPS